MNINTYKYIYIYIYIYIYVYIIYNYIHMYIYIYMANAQKVPRVIRAASLSLNARPWKQGVAVGWSRKGKRNKMRNTENKSCIVACEKTCVLREYVQRVLRNSMFSHCGVWPGRI